MRNLPKTREELLAILLDPHTTAFHALALLSYWEQLNDGDAGYGSPCVAWECLPMLDARELLKHYDAPK